MAERITYIVTHKRFAVSSPIVNQVAQLLGAYGFSVTVLDSDSDGTQPAGRKGFSVDPSAEIVVVLGGDGTILRAVEIVKGTQVPVIGINLGHIGFLAEFESFEISKAIKRIAEKDYTIEKRMIADVELWLPHRPGPVHDWALNDTVVYHGANSPMIQVGITVDDVAVSSFGCDGVIASTPTGSTAYAFSAGGPIIWPGVKALELLPIAAHALFTRPLIAGSESSFGIHVLEVQGDDAVMTCDGRRVHTVPADSRITVRESADTLRLARLSGALFADRLVTKFNLPVVGWREQAERRIENGGPLQDTVGGSRASGTEKFIHFPHYLGTGGFNQAINDGLSEMDQYRMFNDFRADED